MIKYAKLINEETKQCEVGIGTNDEFYKSIGLIEMDVEYCDWNGSWYLTGYAPEKPEPSHDEVIKKQIQELEDKITQRNMRGAILGDEFAMNKITEIESEIAELRKQLED